MQQRVLAYEPHKSGRGMSYPRRLRVTVLGRQPVMAGIRSMIMQTLCDYASLHESHET